MAPKSAAAKAKAEAQASAKVAEKESKKAEATERAQAKKDQEEEAAALEAAKQKKDLCNFVTQGKAAEPGTKLADAFEYYKALPLRSDQKQQIATNWRGDRSCTWLNSYVDSHKTTKVVESAESSGWRTSYWIAKELGMPHDSPVFEAVLKGYKKGEPCEWSDEDPAQKPFKDANLPAYFFCDKSLELMKNLDTHEQNLSSMSVAKKAKLSLTDIVNAPGDGNSGAKVTIQFEQWHACNAHVRAIEAALQLYTAKTADLKNLQVAYQKFSATDSLAVDLQTVAEERIGFMTLALQEISAMEIKSLALLSHFSSFNKGDEEGLQAFHGSLTDHLADANRLHDAVCQRAKKNQAWLDSQ
jgi:hypothetical protein